jgi:hypothetical protein
LLGAVMARRSWLLVVPDLRRTVSEDCNFDDKKLTFC